MCNRRDEWIIFISELHGSVCSDFLNVFTRVKICCPFLERCAGIKGNVPLATSVTFQPTIGLSALQPFCKPGPGAAGARRLVLRRGQGKGRREGWQVRLGGLARSPFFGKSAHFTNVTQLHSLGADFPGTSHGVRRADLNMH